MESATAVMMRGGRQDVSLPDSSSEPVSTARGGGARAPARRFQQNHGLRGPIPGLTAGSGTTPPSVRQQPPLCTQLGRQQCLRDVVQVDVYVDKGRRPPPNSARRPAPTPYDPRGQIMTDNAIGV